MKTKNIKYGLKSHEKRFGTEQKCRNYLVRLKWNGRPTCDRCQNNHMNYYLKSRGTWKCRNCSHHFSVIKDSIFESTKLPLTTWFKAIYFITTMKRGLSSYQLARILEVQQRTAFFMLHRLREAMKDENIVLNGIIEADESHFGPTISKDTRLQRMKKVHDKMNEEKFGMTKSKKRRLRGKPTKNGRKKGSTKEVLAKKKKEREKLGERIPFEQDIAVLGMVERGKAGKAVLKVLGRSEKSKTKENIYPYLKKHINPSATLFTDEWNLYDDTSKLFKDHQTVKHRDKEFVRGMVHTNTIENLWLHFSKMIKGTFFHLSLRHFQKYLTEHSFRWNRLRNNDKEKVDSFFDGILGKRLKYKDLISLPKQPYRIIAA